MTLPLTLTELRPALPGSDLLIVGPSLGTAVEPLWTACVAQLGADLHVVGWDLPGHGSSPAADKPVTLAELAESVLSATAPLRAGTAGRTLYAGVSLGGAVGLQLAVDHGDAVHAVAVICSGAKIGEADAWHDRAALVRRAGTPVMVEGSAQRWFAPGFIEREPATVTALLSSLQEADRFSYARCCEALADFDLRDRLGEVTVPLIAIAGAQDPATPAELAREIALGSGGSAVVIEGAAHLAPAEQPAKVAEILTDFFARARSGQPTGEGLL